MSKRAALQYRIGVGIAVIAGVGATVLAASDRPVWAVIWLVVAAINVRLAFVNRKMT